ncbi:hypothetical protein SAMN05421767_10653 [Granulicatella balaenopterae]|uniref:Uncharacterized protein n=1 Tax=Granulicatella balaenopterae TaxID=137733 RepID=A0A1H9IPC1_9LACT|nr:hypothetical protein [Granulicatella balaenopterae]SEQ76601.1 hypothetical protein SAMN05421767_10653 [Granulicatella balaenopterae]
MELKRQTKTFKRAMKAAAKNIIDFPLRCVKCIASHEIDIDIMSFVAKSMMKVVIVGSVAVSIATIMFAHANYDALHYGSYTHFPTAQENLQKKENEKRDKELQNWLDVHMP